ncbi:hypothetical protein H9P43_004159 [Blastocladiella emersonii ATCC 22665]|nr:hypothetical protein H9P43_004159 [Blastocladiella emersonii ATCC 22665]
MTMSDAPPPDPSPPSDEAPSPQQPGSVSEIIRHLRSNSTHIRISYTATKLAIHVALILLLAWEAYWSTCPPPRAGTTSVPFAPAPTSSPPPLDASFPGYNFTSGSSDACTWPLAVRYKWTLRFTLVYLVAALATVAAYLPLVDKVVHVYALWPLNYYLHELVVLRLQHGDGNDRLRWAQILLPWAASLVYHLYLRRTLVAVRLWQHSRSFPHLHAAAPHPGIAAGVFARRTDSELGTLTGSPPPSPTTAAAAASRAKQPVPGIHPARVFVSHGRQLVYRAYTLVAPYAGQAVVAVVGGLGAGAGFAAPALPPGWTPLSPVLCVASWLSLKLFVSFHCFQVQYIVWNPRAVGRQGVLVWRGQADGWRAGVFV